MIKAEALIALEDGKGGQGGRIRQVWLVYLILVLNDL